MVKTVSDERHDDHRDPLRPDLLQGSEGQSQSCFAGQNVGVTQVGDRIWLEPSCNTTWAILMMRRAGWNRSRIRSARKCYLCAGMNCHPCVRNGPRRYGVPNHSKLEPAPDVAQGDGDSTKIFRKCRLVNARCVELVPHRMERVSTSGGEQPAAGDAPRERDFERVHIPIRTAARARRI